MTQYDLHSYIRLPIGRMYTTATLIPRSRTHDTSALLVCDSAHRTWRTAQPRRDDTRDCGKAMWCVSAHTRPTAQPETQQASNHARSVASGVCCAGTECRCARHRCARRRRVRCVAHRPLRGWATARAQRRDGQRGDDECYVDGRLKCVSGSAPIPMCAASAPTSAVMATIPR